MSILSRMAPYKATMSYFINKHIRATYRGVRPNPGNYMPPPRVVEGLVISSNHCYGGDMLGVKCRCGEVKNIYTHVYDIIELDTTFDSWY